MKKITLLLLLISSVCFGQVKKSLKVPGGSTFEYWEFPKATSTKMPLIIFLHGLGEKGSIDAVLTAGLPKHLRNGLDIPFIVLAPRSGSGWFDPKLYVQPLINYYKTLPNIDSNRIYLTGLSAGANGTYKYLVSGFDDVAAYLPISINSNEFTPVTNKNRPVWHFHGNKDGDPNKVTTSAGFITKYNSIYAGAARRTVFTNLGHNAWDATYLSQFSQPTQTGDTTLYHAFDVSPYEWLLKHTLNPPVEEVPVPTVYLKMDSVIVEGTRAWTTATDGKVYSWEVKRE